MRRPSLFGLAPLFAAALLGCGTSDPDMPAVAGTGTTSDAPAPTETTGGPPPSGSSEGGSTAGPGDATTTSATTTTEPSGGTTGAPPVDPADIDWDPVGFGVAYQEIPDAPGDDVFIAYGGYTAELPWTEAWVQELYRARLRELGVRHLYAVQGPADPGYSGLEIGNSALAAHLVPLAGDAERIRIAAHSSGAFVAHELLQQLTVGGLDPDAETAGRIAYYDLDGGGAGLGAEQVAHLQSLAFVYAADGPSLSANADTMMSLAAMHAGSTLVELDATDSGCDPGAQWCLHDTVIIARPHDPTNYDLERDYQEFDDDHPVVTDYL